MDLLSHDELVAVLRRLPASALSRAACVSRLLRTAAHDESLWRAHCAALWPEGANIGTGAHCPHTYRQCYLSANGWAYIDKLARCIVTPWSDLPRTRTARAASDPSGGFSIRGFDADDNRLAALCFRAAPHGNAQTERMIAIRGFESGVSESHGPAVRAFWQPPSTRVPQSAGMQLLPEGCRFGSLIWLADGVLYTLNPSGEVTEMKVRRNTLSFVRTAGLGGRRALSAACPQVGRRQHHYTDLPMGFDWRAASPEVLITNAPRRVSLIDLEARARAHADRRSLPPDRLRTRAQAGSPIAQCACPRKSNCATWVKSAVGATDHPQIATLGLSEQFGASGPPPDPPPTNDVFNDSYYGGPPLSAGKTSALATIDFRVPPPREPPPPPPPRHHGRRNRRRWPTASPPCSTRTTTSSTASSPAATCRLAPPRTARTFSRRPRADHPAGLPDTRPQALTAHAHCRDIEVWDLRVASSAWRSDDSRSTCVGNYRCSGNGPDFDFAPSRSQPSLRPAREPSLTPFSSSSFPLLFDSRRTCVRSGTLAAVVRCKPGSTYGAKLQLFGPRFGPKGAAASPASSSDVAESEYDRHWRLSAGAEVTLSEVVIDSNWRLGTHRGVRLRGSSLSVLVDEQRLLRCAVPRANGADAPPCA